MSSPSTPSPAAHRLTRLCQSSGRGTGGHIVRFWAMLSTPHRHTSPPIDQQPAAGHRLDVLPSCPLCPRPLPSCGEVGQSKRNRKRGNYGEGCRRYLRQFLASLLLRLMSTPSTPSPNARRLTRSQHRTW